MNNAMQSTESPHGFVDDHPHLDRIGHIGLQQQEFCPYRFHLLQATNSAVGVIMFLMLCYPVMPLLSSRESRAAYQHESRLHAAGQVLGQYGTDSTEGT